MNPYKTRSKRRKAPPDGAYRCASKNRVIWQHQRTSVGLYLVELLVALVLGTMVTLTLASMMTTTIKLTTSSQNDVYVDTIINQLSDFTRSAPYEFLVRQMGPTHLLLENGNEVQNTVLSEPLQHDKTKQWFGTTNSIYFPGTVTYKIENGPFLNSLKVTIAASWTDTARTQTKTTTSTIMVFRDALKNQD